MFNFFKSLIAIWFTIAILSIFALINYIQYIGLLPVIFLGLTIIILPGSIFVLYLEITEIKNREGKSSENNNILETQNLDEFEDLGKLERFYNDRLISTEEYENKRKKILERNKNEK